MKNIWNIIGKNKKEAIELIKKNIGVNVELDFSKNHTEEEIEREECFPFVLISNRHFTIGDYTIGKVKLIKNKGTNNSDTLEIYVNEWEEWVSISECLSSTENNVYLAIEDFFNNN